MADGAYVPDRQCVSGARWGVSSNNSRRGRNDYSSRHTRKLSGLLLSFVALAVHHFTKGTISFQNVGSEILSTFGSRIHENWTLANRHLFISAANSRKRANVLNSCNVFGLRGDCWYQARFWACLIDVGSATWPRALVLEPFPAGVLVVLSGWLSSDYWTWPEQQL